MKAHSLQILNTCHLAKDPIEDLEAAPKRYVDAATQKGIFITDITPTSAGIVALKEYAADTIPENALVSEATTNTAEVRVHFLVEPNSTLFNVGVQANGVDAQSIEQSSQDARLYEGYVDIVVDDQLLEETVTVISSTGAEASATLNILVGAPDFDSAIIGALPGVQTEVKQGDTLPVSGVVGNDAVEVKIINFGASGEEKVLNLGAEDSAGPGLRTFDGTFTVSSRNGSYTAQVVSKNILGTESEGYNTSNQVTLNQTYPSIGSASFSYPASQEAIKGSESVDVTVSISDADEYDYSVASGMSVNDESTYAATKTITRVDETIQYQINSNNYSITATKASNGAVSSRDFKVKVVNVPASVDLSFTAGQTLRSSAAGVDYTLVLSPDQPLLNAPDALSASAGSFIGSWVDATGDTWRHSFRITDSDVRGSHTFSALTVTGLSGITSSVIDSGDTFTIAGLVERDVIVPALSQAAPLGVSVADPANVIATYKGADTLEYRGTDLSQYAKGFTIVSMTGPDGSAVFDANGDHIYITDASFAGTNTTGTLTLTVEETL